MQSMAEKKPKRAYKWTVISRLDCGSGAKLLAKIGRVAE